MAHHQCIFQATAVLHRLAVKYYLIKVIVEVSFSLNLGTFEPFDTSNPTGLSGPRWFGFSAGKFVDGSESYIGIGQNPSGVCKQQNPCPGRSKKSQNLSYKYFLYILLQSLTILQNLALISAVVEACSLHKKEILTFLIIQILTGLRQT